MNTIVRPAPDSIEVDQLLKDIDAVPQGHYWLLDPDHELYCEPLDVWVRPASDFDDPEYYAGRIGTRSSTVAFGDFYDLTGRKVPMRARPESWWKEQTEITPVNSSFYEPNAAHRLGADYIMVGRGKYEIVAETTLDGERAFEFISLWESVRRAEAECQSFVPLAQRFLPEWATEVAIITFDDQSIEVFFSTDNLISPDCEWDAEATVKQFVVLDHDGTILESEPPLPEVSIGERTLKSGPMSPADMRLIAAGMERLAVEFERITAA